MQRIQRKIFFLIEFTALTISSLIEMLQVTHTSWILSMGINDAAPTGLYRSQHYISTGFNKLFLQVCSWSHFMCAMLISTWSLPTKSL